MPLRRISSQNRGFTLLELITVVALFSTLLVLGLCMSSDTLANTFSRSDRAVIISLLQRARARAMSNAEQSQWGVCFSYPDYIVFEGTVCPGNAASATELAAANPAVASSSDFGHAFPTVVFTQLSGTTTPATVTLVQDGRTATISTTYEGTIVW